MTILSLLSLCGQTVALIVFLHLVIMCFHVLPTNTHPLRGNAALTSRCSIVKLNSNMFEPVFENNGSYVQNLGGVMLHMPAVTFRWGKKTLMDILNLHKVSCLVKIKLHTVSLMTVIATPSRVHTHPHPHNV